MFLETLVFSIDVNMFKIMKLTGFDFKKKRASCREERYSKHIMYLTAGSDAGRSRIHVLYAPRDYRSEGSSASELKEVAVKQSTEVLFQPLNSKKPKKFKLPSIVSLTLSA